MKKSKGGAGGPQKQDLRASQLGKGTFRIIDQSDGETVAWAYRKDNGLLTPSYWAYRKDYWTHRAPRWDTSQPFWNWQVVKHAEHFEDNSEETALQQFENWAKSDHADVEWRKSTDAIWPPPQP